MASFEIVRTDDPSAYRGQILRLWEKNLPGTPAERFEWMREGNPAGPTTWFLAFEEGSGEIAGTVTIMPRRLYRGGRQYMAGIMGDFMVDAAHRVFGPNLMLVRAALNSLGDLGLSFIYTVPNESSRKVTEHVGVRYVTALDCWARPLDYGFYLRKRLPAPVASLLSPAAGAAFRISSRETWMSFAGEVEETPDIGKDFEGYWERLRDGAEMLTGERSAAYLRWRYQANPLYRFRFLACRKRGSGEMSGFTVFCTREENKLDVYDLQADDGGSFDALVRALIEAGRAMRSQAVYIIAPRWSSSLARLGKFRFLDTKDTLQLGFFGGQDLSLEEWHFMSGDRNI
jgi:hypothetical protein